MELLKRWASTQNISIIAVILFVGLVLTSYFRQIEPIKSLEEQVKESEHKVGNLIQKADSLNKKATTNEKQRIEENNRIDILPDDELQYAIDSAFYRP